jgi:hypothetical protein
MQIVSRLLEKLGMELEQLSYDHEQQEWLYQINQEFWHDLDRIAVWRSLDEKYADLKAGSPAVSEVGATEPKASDLAGLYINNVEPRDQFQSYTEQAFQSLNPAIFAASQEGGELELDDESVLESEQKWGMWDSFSIYSSEVIP